MDDLVDFHGKNFKNETNSNCQTAFCATSNFAENVNYRALKRPLAVNFDLHIYTFSQIYDQNANNLLRSFRISFQVNLFQKLVFNFASTYRKMGNFSIAASVTINSRIKLLQLLDILGKDSMRV